MLLFRRAAIGVLVALSALGVVGCSSATRHPPPPVQAALKAALDTGNFGGVQGSFAPSVGYAIAASGSFGTMSSAETVGWIAGYLAGTHGPWDFAIPAAALDAFKKGPYRQYLHDDTYFGVNADKFFISVRVNAAGAIDQVFMAASTDLLK